MINNSTLTVLTFGQPQAFGAKLEGFSVAEWNVLIDEQTISSSSFQDKLALFTPQSTTSPSDIMAKSPIIPYLVVCKDDAAAQSLSGFQTEQERGQIKWVLSTKYAYQYVTLVDDILRVVEVLSEGRYTKDLEVRAKIALQESIANALLHGNLELSSLSEPPYSGDIDQYYDEADKRVEREELADRMLKVKADITDQMLRFTICDDGDRIIEGQSRVDDPFSLSGRGTFLMRTNCDRLEISVEPTTVEMDFRW